MDMDRGMSLTLIVALTALHAGCGGGADAAQVAKAAQVARGEYLVTSAGMCAECHSPRKPDGSFDRARWLSGIDCYEDFVPADPAVGCISTRNLTHHETGLKNRTDREIKDMFLKGMRPDGKGLQRFMPYRFYANMREADADAIVAYLRTVPGVDHTLAPHQPPFLPLEKPEATIPEAHIPPPRADYPDHAAALRGRYLAGTLGNCMNCHTPRDTDNRLMVERAFQGGLKMPGSVVGKGPGVPQWIYTSNLTPHRTGIAHYTIDQIVRALKHGEDADQDREPLCPPMPAGSNKAFGGLTDADATDIAHYLRSLTPGDNPMPEDCRMPPQPTLHTSARP